MKILALPVDFGGCGWYRVRQPLFAIKEYTDNETHVINKESDDPILVLNALLDADILIVRQGGEVGIKPLQDAANDYALETRQAKRFHAKIVMDIDDNIELISPYSEHYGEYGVKDFYDEESKTWIWKDGETPGYNPAENRVRIMNLLSALRSADLVTVTTEKLAEYARQYNGSVSVFPNVINPSKWWKPPFTHNRQLRIGWSGGHSHYEDWYSIKEPLNTLLRKYQFKLVMAGTSFDGIIDHDLRHLVEAVHWEPFDAHSYRQMLNNLDIAIIPLSDNPFNSYKSSIKWFEMSAMGVPSVVANVTPYKEVFTDKINALGYDTQEEFMFSLDALIRSRRLRKWIGNNALKEITDKWTTKVWAEKYADIYRAIL